MSGRVRIVIALWVLSLINYIDRVAISFAGPTIMSSLHISPAYFGLVLSSFGVGYILSLIPGGMIADRWGTRLVVLVTPVLWALFTGLTGFVTVVGSFVLVRFALGVSEGLFTPSIYKTIGDNFDHKQRSFALAMCMSALALGPALAGPVVGILIGAFSWQLAFAFLALPAILAAFLGYLLLPASVNNRVVPTTEEKVPFRTLLRHRSLWLLALSNFATDIAQWGFMGWMPSYLAMERGINLKTHGHIGSIPFIAGAVGLLVGGWLGTSALSRYRPQLIVAAYVAAAASLVIAYQADDLLLAVVGLSCATFFMYGALAPKGAVVIGAAPSAGRASFVGVYTVAGQIGGASAPAIIGFLVAQTGAFAAGFGFMIAGLLVASLSILALVPTLRSQARQVAASAAA